MVKVLVDGDILAYRAAFATQDREHSIVYHGSMKKDLHPNWSGITGGKVTFKRFYKCQLKELIGEVVYYAVFQQDFSPKDAEEKVEILLDFVLEKTLDFVTPDQYEVYLTGSNNFRFDVAKSHPYKGNRTATEKPKHLKHIRDYLVKKFGAIVSEGEEADDLIAIEATRLGPDTIVASIDKDMLQIPCRHFNFNKKEWTTVDEWSGTLFFYTQILTGDAADNIKGLYGIGPKKADKLLLGCSTEQELWKACVKAYEGDTERIIENARLLWLRRFEGQTWEPPLIE